MIGVKLKALGDYLVDVGNIASNTLDYSIENGKLTTVSKNLGNGFVIARCDYSGMVEIKDCTLAPETLCALVAIWLIEFDPCRNDDRLAPPDFDLDGVTGKKANVDFTIDFREDIEMVEDVDGPLLFRGVRYSVQPVGIVDVDSIAVGNDQSIPTDLPVTTDDID